MPIDAAKVAFMSAVCKRSVAADEGGHLDMNRVPPETRLTILASHKLGHVMQCEAVARALGLVPDIRPVRPRALFRLFAPSGPPDWRDLGNRPDAALREPYPDIALASGRETVPYLRSLKKRSPQTFCIYMGDPRTSHGIFDLIALPDHDDYRAGNVTTFLTTPHPRDEATLEDARQRPDSRVAALKQPRIAMLLGGPSANYTFEPADIVAIAGIAQTALSSGASIMVSVSRRTPATLTEKISAAIAQAGVDQSRAFIYDSSGANPYVSMLALADTIVVTADSVNMIGEAVSTGKPVYLYEPTGHAGKFMHLLGQLTARHAIRRWEGKFESWTYTPVNSTPAVAAEIAARYLAFRAKTLSGS